MSRSVPTTASARSMAQPPCASTGSLRRRSQTPLATRERVLRKYRLARTAEGVELDVVDDGVGFDPDHDDGHGLGLRSIRERVRFAKGSLRIESRPGHGTKLLVRIPLSTARSDASPRVESPPGQTWPG